MSDGINRFFNAIENAEKCSDAELIDLFVYFLTVESGAAAATASNIEDCFKACHLTPSKRVRAHLSEGLRSKPQRFVKVDGGYSLQRHHREALSKRLGAERTVVQTSVELRRLEARLNGGPAKGFLKETIDCFEVGANRATIVMCWILIMDHLFELVLRKHLTPFNAELAKINDKRVKVSIIAARDDFGEIPEGKFIELLRASGVISNDVRKILDQKLGVRNSSAHPSGVLIKGSKVIDFVEDLVENVVIKYPL